jgi:hypothetical protein
LNLNSRIIVRKGAVCETQFWITLHWRYKFQIILVKIMISAYIFTAYFSTD